MNTDAHYCQIIHIDDNPRDLELMQLAFDATPIRPYAYVGISDPTIGMKQLLEPTARPWIVILDLNMPVVTGVQILECVRAEPRLKDTLIIILTTSRSPSDREQCLALGATAVIAKPATFNELVEVAQYIMERC